MSEGPVVVIESIGGPIYPSVVAKVAIPDVPGMVFRVRLDADLELVEFAVETESDPLTARAIRAVPVRKIGDAVRREVTHHRALLEELAPRPSGPRWQTGQASLKHPGRKGRADLAYARDAALYVACLSEDPKRAMVLFCERAEPFDPDQQSALDSHQGRTRLGEARRRGLLTAARKGFAGGHLTEKCKMLLRNNPRVSPSGRAWADERRAAFESLDPEDVEAFQAFLEETVAQADA